MYGVGGICHRLILNYREKELGDMNATYCITGSNAKMCAFCKQWYDPTNSAIEHQNHCQGLTGLWIQI